MTEARMAKMVYNETQAERNNLKKSASHKKNGSAVQKLGNRPMSYQEILEKHGPCKTYSIEGLLSFEQFKDLPNDLKIEWINKICDKYDVSIKHISRYLFEDGDYGLKHYLASIKDVDDILSKCNYQKGRGKTKLLVFQNDIREWKRNEKIAKIIDNNEKREQMQDFITYDQYKKLSLQDQLNYINGLIEKYEVGADTISIELYEKGHSTIRNGIFYRGRKLGDSDIVNKLKRLENLNPDYRREKNVAFKKIAKEWKENKEMHTEPEEAVVKTIEKETPEEAKDVFEVVSIEELDANSKNDVCKPVPLPYIEENKPEPISTPELEYHDMHFSVSYIGKGINIEELNSYAAIIGKTRVKVVIDICTV